MKLYHGSPYKFDVLKRNQAKTKEGTLVPKEELENAIYFSPSYSFALAMCSMPRGLTNVDWDNMTIETEFPKNFDPNKKVYIYEIDSGKIPESKIKQIDEMRLIADLDEIKFDSMKETTAGEILDYYKMVKTN